jgi:uncharacterized protein YijF (DUF1287 family)
VTAAIAVAVAAAASGAAAVEFATTMATRASFKTAAYESVSFIREKSCCTRVLPPTSRKEKLDLDKCSERLAATVESVLARLQRERVLSS